MSNDQISEINEINEEDTLEILELKNKLFQISTRCNRGEDTSNLTLNEEALEIISDLESLNPAFIMPEGTYSLDGDWELIYSDSQLFTSSPFFLSLKQEFFRDNLDQANLAFDLHRAATATGRIKKVLQNIDLSGKFRFP